MSNQNMIEQLQAMDAANKLLEAANLPTYSSLALCAANTVRPSGPGLAVSGASGSYSPTQRLIQLLGDIPGVGGVVPR